MGFVEIGGLALLGIFVFYLFFSFLFGLGRGMKRQLLRFGLIVLCIVLALGFTKPLYNTALNADLSFAVRSIESESIQEKLAKGEKVTMSGLVSSVLGDSLGAGEEGDATSGLMDATSETMADLLLPLPALVLNLLIFIILFFILRFLTWIIYGVLKGILFRSDKSKIKNHKRYPNEYPKFKKRRLIGGGIGLLQGAAIALVIMVPFAALAGALDSFAGEVNQEKLSSALNIDSETLGDIFGVSSMYTDSVPGKIYGALGLDKMLYKPLTTAKIDGQSFALEDIAKAAGKSVNALADYQEINERVSNAQTEEEFKAAFLELLEFAENTLTDILDNDFIKAVLGPVGKSVGLNVDEIYSADSEDSLELALRQLIIDIAGDNTANNNLATNLKNDLLAIVEIGKDLNNSGILYNILGNESQGFDLEKLLEGDNAEVFGSAVDDLLKTKMLANSKQYLFVYALGSLSTGDAFPIDLSEIKFEHIVWKDAAVTMLKVIRFTGEMESGDFGDSSAGKRVVEIIDSLDKQSPETGLMKAFENVIKNMLAELDIEGVDAEYLSSKDLNPSKNKEQIGALVDLVFDLKDLDLSEMSSGDVKKAAATLKTVNGLIDRLEALKNGDGDFVDVIDKIIAAYLKGLGEFGSGSTIEKLGDVLESVSNVLEAMDIVSGLKEGETLSDLQPEEIARLEELAENLISSLADEDLFALVEEFIPAGEVSLPEGYGGLVEEELSKLVEKEQDEAKLDHYKKIAEKLGINPDSIGLGGLPARNP